MKTSYSVEIKWNRQIAITEHLFDAKRIVETRLDKDTASGAIITKLLGPAVGEGWHCYSLIFVGRKWRRVN